MKNIFVALIASLLLLGCDARSYQSVSNREMVKMTPNPIWGGSITKEIAPGGDCHIDSINDEPGEGSSSHSIIRSESALNVAGWGAISAQNGIVADDMALALKDNSTQRPRIFAAVTKEKRPDVAEYFKNPMSVDTGFRALIDLSDVPPGDYELELIQHKDGKVFKCRYTSSIIVKGSGPGFKLQQLHTSGFFQFVGFVIVGILLPIVMVFGTKKIAVKHRFVSEWFAESEYSNLEDGSKRILKFWLVYLAVGGGISAALLAVAWPGFMSYDSLLALRGAREGVQNSLWPPMVSYIWWMVERIYPGPSGMLFLQNMLLAASTAWFLHAAGARLKLVALATFLIFAAPPILGPSFVVWKDIEMAAFLMLGFASYAAFRAEKKRGLLIACALALSVACLIRHNAFIAVIPLIVHWAATNGWSRSKAALVASIAILVICFLPGRFINHYRIPDLMPLSSFTSSVLQKRAIHDAIGASVCSGQNFLASVMKQPFDVDFLRSNYSARHYNENMEILKRINANTFDSAATYLAIWRDSPECLFANKISLGKYILGINQGPVYYMTHPGIDENEFGYKLQPSGLRDFFIRALKSSSYTPFAAPASYLFVLSILFAVAWRKQMIKEIPVSIKLLSASGLIMLVSNFVLLPAADLRYEYWPTLTWITSSVLIFAQLIRRKNGSSAKL